MAPTRYRILALLMLAGSACGGPAREQRPAPRRPPAPARDDLPVLSIGGRAFEVGLATYYASRLAGHLTASGERYDPGALTAAHPRLPFGSLVRVTRVDDAGTPIAAPVVVRVNDRGPYGGHGRIIDLSMAAARRLGMTHAGVVKVRLELLGRP